MTQASRIAFQEAQQVLVGGVNSPVRSFKGVSGEPLFIDSASGALLCDIDGRQYIDYVCSWGAVILGHNSPVIANATREAIDKGMSFGAPTLLETRLAKLIKGLMPSLQKVRMCNSGSEASMSAIRLARGHTKRDGIIKFSGCYHGHVDSLLAKAGSGALTLGVPDSAGVPNSLAKHTLIAEYNDIDDVAELFEQHGSRIACVIVEPIAGNMGCILAEPSFLEGLDELCRRHGALLIFDEVMSGFRVGLGGAQQLYGIKPHLSLLGKIVGGGLPIGILGGDIEIMDQLAPLGPVYQAGTLSGNPIAMAAGIATLEALTIQENFYQTLKQKARQLQAGWKAAAADKGIHIAHSGAGGMFGIFFSADETAPRNYQQVLRCDAKRYARFFHAMLARGVYLAPSPFEAGFISDAHSEKIIADSIDAARDAFEELASADF